MEVVGIIVLRAVEIPFEPRASPVLAVAVDRTRLASIGVVRDRRANDILRKCCNGSRIQSPSGDCGSCLRHSLHDSVIEPREDLPPFLIELRFLAEDTSRSRRMGI